MQTIQFLQTAKWIKSQFSERSKSLLLEGELIRYASHRAADESSPSSDLRNEIIEIINELSTIQPRLASELLSCEVLKGFDLNELLDPIFPVTFGKLMLSGSKGEEGESMEAMLLKISKNWNLLDRCIEPIEKITTPSAIIQEKDFDEILTIELRYTQELDPSVETIAEVLKDVGSIYGDVAKLMGEKDAGNLVTIYAASGSNYRFDFSGLGEPIKQMKNLIVEGWERIRHRKAEDLERNAKAVLSGLRALDEIKSRRDKKVVPDEDADKLSQKITNSMSDLFRKGALIREIPREQTISNQQLIEGIQQRRLPPPVPKQLPKAKVTKKGSKKLEPKKRKT